MDLTVFDDRISEIGTARMRAVELQTKIEERLEWSVVKIREELKPLDEAEAHVADLLARLKADLSQPEPAPPTRAAKGSVTREVRALYGNPAWDGTTSGMAAALGLKVSSVAKALKKIRAEEFRKMVERKGREQTAAIEAETVSK